LSLILLQKLRFWQKKPRCDAVSLFEGFMSLMTLTRWQPSTGASGDCL